MTTGSLETVDNRPALRFERRLDHSVERVWSAVTEPAELERWFVAPVAWKPELGEVFEGGGDSGQITELEAPRVLAWTWANELYRFELRPEGDGCLLVFTHVFNRAFGPAAQHAAGWETYLNRLEAHLAGGFLSERDAHAVFATLNASYVERFGPDADGASVTGRDSITLEDGPTLRFERRYEHPAERVWRAISDPAERSHWFPAGEDLQVTESDPPLRLAGSWYGEEQHLELQPEGSGCTLVFTHAFADRARAARDGAGWDRCFARFSALLAGEPLGEADSLEGWPEVHERYAERFGVDPRLGREAFAQHGAQQS